MSDVFKTGSFIVGTYRVLDFIGEGAMGLVYKVEHNLLNKILAFKVLKTEHLSESAWKRFHIEAQAIARLDHPNIVKIYDMSQTEDGTPFFTMDLLVGQSLDDYLQDYGRLTVEEALPIFRQICSGLAYANDHGIIHRDIKPGNIMLTDIKNDNIAQCTVKIVDFGIAKLVDDGNTAQQGLTKPGEVFGSPLYMSPEQCMGSKLDQRTDMYSVGITMFQALTGKPPLLGKSAVETAALHQTQEPPMLCDIAPDVDFPIELEEVIATMLEKSREDRYESLAEVANELLRIERGENKPIPRERAANDIHRQNQWLPDREISLEDTQNRTGQRAQALTKAQLLLVAALALTGLATTLYLLFPVKVKSAKTVATYEQLVPIPKGEMSESYELISKEESKEINEYLASHKGSYSRTENINGKLLKVFDFPEKFSLGRIYYNQGQNGDRFEAIGTQSIPANSHTKLQGSRFVQAYPELLTRFRPDDLNWFSINEVAPRNPKLATSVAHLRLLDHLDLKRCALNSIDLKVLEALKRLTVLNISQSVKSKELAEFALLKQLRSLQLEYLEDPSVLIKTLQTYNNLECLDLRHVKLNKNDYICLSQMSRLLSLTAKDCHMTDSDVEALSKLSNLRFFNIDACNDLTSNCLASIRKFKNLRHLVLPEGLYQKQTKKKLQQLLPGIIIIEGDSNKGLMPKMSDGKED